MKKVFLLFTLVLSVWGEGIYHDGWIDFNKNGVMDVYENPKADINDRIDDLLKQMTVEEKTCQCATLYGSGRVLKDALPTDNWVNEIWKDGIGNIDEEHSGQQASSNYSYPPSKHVEALEIIQRWFVENTRLGIPVDWTNEGIRGIAHDRATFFPSQSAQGNSWDRKLIARIAEVEGTEANLLGYTNIYGPIMDLAQDARFGRVMEMYGEDPYLVGELGLQKVRGLQALNVVATMKHFAVYSVPVGGRDGGTRTDPHVAEREMRTLYLEPFRKGIVVGRAKGVMSSYNDFDGVPVSGSHRFLTEILREQYGFDGYVVSDSDAVEYLYDKHAVVGSLEDAAALAINAGLNVHTNFHTPDYFINPLRDAVSHGKVAPEVLDARVADILRVKFWLGLFDNPYRGDGTRADDLVHCAEHQAVSLQAGLEGLVLLKNENSTLPLPKTFGRVLVTGPLANSSGNLEDRYGPANAPIVTVLQGIKSALPNSNVVFSQGCQVKDNHFPQSELHSYPKNDTEQKEMDNAVAEAAQADAIIVALGGNAKTIGESMSRTSLELPGYQEELLEKMMAAGKPLVLVLVDGRASTINWAADNVPAILYAGFPGEFTGTVIARALFGDYNPGGKLAVTFPKSVGQLPFSFPYKPGSEADFSNGVSGSLFPFGHGLSYTNFTYSNLTISPTQECLQGNVTVTVKVKNTGKVEGDEIVQLYIRDEVSSVTRYTKELRGFERITLQPGEEQTLTFLLTPQELALWDKNMNFVVEPGWFTVYIGASYKDIRLNGRFEIAPVDCGTGKKEGQDL